MNVCLVPSVFAYHQFFFLACFTFQVYNVWNDSLIISGNDPVIRSPLISLFAAPFLTNLPFFYGLSSPSCFFFSLRCFRIYDAKANQAQPIQRADCEGHTDSVTILVLDVNLLFSGSADGTVRVWNAWYPKDDTTATATLTEATNLFNQYLPHPPSFPSGDLQPSADADFLSSPSFSTPRASGSSSCSSSGSPLFSLSCLLVFSQHTRPLRDLLLVPHYGHLVTCGMDGLVCVWDYVHDSILYKFTYSKEDFRCLAFRPSTGQIFIGTEMNKIMVFQYMRDAKKTAPSHSTAVTIGSSSASSSSSSASSSSTASSSSASIPSSLSSSSAAAASVSAPAASPSPVSTSSSSSSSSYLSSSATPKGCLFFFGLVLFIVSYSMAHCLFSGEAEPSTLPLWPPVDDFQFTSFPLPADLVRQSALLVPALTIPSSARSDVSTTLSSASTRRAVDGGGFSSSASASSSSFSDLGSSRTSDFSSRSNALTSPTTLSLPTSKPSVIASPPHAVPSDTAQLTAGSLSSLRSTTDPAIATTSGPLHKVSWLDQRRRIETHPYASGDSDTET